MRAVLLAARRLGGVVVHGDALGGMDHFDRQIGVRRDACCSSCFDGGSVADQKDPVAILPCGVDCAFDFRHRGFIAPHRVYCNGDHLAQILA